MLLQILENSGAAVQEAVSAANEVTSEVSSSGSSSGGSGSNPWQWVFTIGIWVVVIAAAYFLFIRPQKKRQKAEDELRNSIEIGDDVTTIGGIVGRVISVRDDDDTVMIETGSDRTRMRFKKWSIASVDTPEKQIKKEDKKDKNKDTDEDGKKKDKDKYDEDGNKKKDKKNKDE